jgi:hypothetical protein
MRSVREVLSNRAIATTAAALAAVAVLGACGKGHAEGNHAPNPGVSADASAPAAAPTDTAPAETPTDTPTEHDDGTGGTGDLDNAYGGDTGTVKGPESPLIFVLGDHAGSTALFGCMKEGTKVYTFGGDFIEGSIKGASVTEHGITKHADNIKRPGQLQAMANANPAGLLTGEQQIGGATVDCGHDIDTGTAEFYTEAGPASAADIEVHQPVAQSGDNHFTILETGHA